MNSKELAKDCIINEMFVDCNEPEFIREEYCKKNCVYKCLNDEDYKKIEPEFYGNDLSEY